MILNEFYKRLEQLEQDRCPTCRGLGECDDADLGDIYFNRWTCKTCNGTGLKQNETERNNN